MPEYEYKCNDCGYEFSIGMTYEQYKRYSLDQLVCGNCKKAHVSRAYRPLKTIYKGTGFYTTDKGLKTEHDYEVKKETNK